MKLLKWILIIVGVIAVLFFFVLEPYMREQTKKHSPLKEVVYESDDFHLKVNYSSPLKKGRQIFGELVPFGAIWRTGANEPTTFFTETGIRMADKSLPPGTYSLWTRPNKESWDIIFNKDIPDWGVTVMSGGKETARKPEEDVIEITVPVERLEKTMENFTIDFEDNGELFMFMAWDNTKVKIPVNN
ncbi:DUF2911 domain-containing protein [Cytophaga sp. FL35]|uniref:DUF2911 domain-containing protein n=1 Tax=Cytophaga sp. FL35 TaxID=1904456 RepID=UPI001653E173|nr:DUF2911 domain-containing protein [Cytophaga sp. FL35]MBC6998842.1 DUF2911 domain-containing protein [Cytophaga sp. FL35]